MAATGIVLMSTADDAPTGAARRPLINTSVRAEPRPRSDTSDTEPPPPWLPPGPALATLVAFKVEVAESVFSSCSAFDTPVRAMSAWVSTCTGSAVSPSMRLIDEPVTSTRSVFCAAGAAVCATAGNPSSSVEATAPPRASAEVFFGFLDEVIAMSLSVEWKE